jgi:hypothetical protein
MIISVKQIEIATLFVRLAEQRLRGCKAYSWRVMAEWLKTPRVVVSRDLSSFLEMGLFPEACG